MLVVNIILKIPIIAFMIFILLSKESIASGMSGHIFIADIATNKLKDKTLKSLLRKHQYAFRDGNIFPDIGLLKSNSPSWGGRTHKKAFINSYYQQIKKNCSFPLNEECEKIVVHFLGVLGHVITDNHYDKYFKALVAKHDFNGKRKDANSFIDYGLEFIVIYEHKRWSAIPRPWSPQKIVLSALDDIGVHLSSSRLKSLHVEHISIITAERIATPFSYLYYKKKAPWAASHYMNAKGGLKDCSLEVAKFISSVWEALVTEKFNRDLIFEHRKKYPYKLSFSIQ